MHMELHPLRYGIVHTIGKTSIPSANAYSLRVGYIEIIMTRYKKNLPGNGWIVDDEARKVPKKVEDKGLSVALKL